MAASDAFFPFADGAEILINAGVKASSSLVGPFVMRKCSRRPATAGVTMYVTGTRHFFH